jgi:hypothetical protein
VRDHGRGRSAAANRAIARCTVADNALRLEIYIKDAEREGDDELETFFRKAQADSRTTPGSIR